MPNVRVSHRKMSRTAALLVTIVAQSGVAPGAFAQTTPPSMADRNFGIGMIEVILGVVVILLLVVAVRALVRRSGKGNVDEGHGPAVKEQDSARIGNPKHPPTTPPQTYRAGMRVFMSYRRDDSADITGRIYDRLAPHFGRDAVFKDVDSIPLGIDFRKHLQDAVGQCSVLVAIIGKRWLDAGMESGKRRLHDTRDHLRIEIETALQRGIPVIPVLVQGASMPAEEDLPVPLQPLAYRNAITVRPDPDFHSDMDRLIKGIQAHVTLGEHPNA